MLRRNKEGEDDDVIMGNEEEPAGVITKDIFGYDSHTMNRARIDFYYNRQDHKLTKLFYLYYLSYPMHTLSFYHLHVPVFYY